jgi:hypothetical protein
VQKDLLLAIRARNFLRTVSSLLLDRLRKRKKSTAGFIVGLIGGSQVWAAIL